MGKYGSFKQELYKRPYDVHPVWRGIGCIMMILIPLDFDRRVNGLDRRPGQKQGWPIPYELMGYPRLPAMAYQIPVIDRYRQCRFQVSTTYMPSSLFHWCS